MPRSISESCPTRPGNTEAWPATAFETLDLQIQVVTPMFGGGAEAGEPDPVTLIRPSSIRGHLRFWWRATRGAACDCPKKLKQREVEIFGDTEHPSGVTLRVESVRTSRSERCAAYGWNPQARRGQGGYVLRWAEALVGNGLPYALFPFQGKPPKRPVQGLDPEKVPSFMTMPFSFRIVATIPRSHASEVRAAIWGWINFGGIGARTRRGCGTLQCGEFSPAGSNQSDIQQWWDLGLRNLVPPTVGAAPESWPIAFRKLLVGSRNASPMTAWDRAVSILRDFRQGSGLGRNPGPQPNQPKRSRWPEPETIRKLTGQRSNGHQRMESIPDNAFPRAELGLPIVFHFKDDRMGDPQDTELYPVVADQIRGRMASPLIMKALAASDGTAVPLIAALRVPALEQVVLIADREPLQFTETPLIRHPSLATYPNSPMIRSDQRISRSSQGSAVEALMSLAQEPPYSFTEVQS